MSVHGIAIDETGRHVPQQSDPVARLEAWQAAGKFREWKIKRYRADDIDVMLGDYRRTLTAREPSLSAAVDAALAAWDGTRTERTDDGRFNRQPDPSPDAIADGCQTIQATWSDRERQRRHNPATAWTVPVVNYEGAD